MLLKFAGKRQDRLAISGGFQNYSEILLLLRAHSNIILDETQLLVLPEEAWEVIPRGQDTAGWKENPYGMGCVQEPSWGIGPAVTEGYKVRS